MFNFSPQVTKNGISRALSVSLGDDPQIDTMYLVLFPQIHYFLKYVQQNTFLRARPNLNAGCKRKPEALRNRKA